jgi:EPS-associated MarR family transcriptional regulator
MQHNVSQEIRYRLLKYLTEHPEATQRQLAGELGISLGKVNYCLRALIQKGLVKAGNFRRSKDKSKYLYVLTPKGIEEKMDVTSSFLRRKMAEYDLLAREIENLTKEVRELSANDRS